MGRASRKSNSSAIREHWTESHPDRHMWSPGRLAVARTQTQEEYETLYGREGAGLDLLVSSPASREEVARILRSFAAGRPDDLLSVVRNYGLPEPDSFLEKVYKRAFAAYVKGVFKERFGISLRQKDPLLEDLYARGRDHFYQDLVRASSGEAYLSTALPHGWEESIFRGQSEIAKDLYGDTKTRPFSEVDPELLRGLLRDSSAWPGALEGSLRREVLGLMRQSIEESRFWQHWDLAHSVMNLSNESDHIRILRGGSSAPLLHLRHPQIRYETVCGKDRLGKGASHDAWTVAAEGNSYKRCPDCESGLAQLEGSEVDEMRKALQNQGDYLPLHNVSESEQDALISNVINSKEVQLALREFQDGADAEVVSRAIFNQSAEFMYSLEEISRQKDEKQDSWSNWKRKIGYGRRREMEAEGLFNDEQAMEEIFSPDIRRAVWKLETRARAAARNGDYIKDRKISKAISHICTHAAGKVLESRKQKPAQTEASVSQ